MKECVILAGGFGTRLQTVIKDVPKCMAEVAGKPFISYLFDYLEKQVFSHVILSLGYKADIVIDWLATQARSFRISYVVEIEPLGTGGAIKFAFGEVEGDNALVINGDTYFDVDVPAICEFHAKNNADLTLSLKPMTNFDRYGSVDISTDGRIVGFNEKAFRSEGLINGGVYLINKQLFQNTDLPAKFSFEKDVMESRINTLRIYGFAQDTYFIDIGIPSDFEKANNDFRK